LPAFVFLGALLLFTVQPLVGRELLPAFGGGFHVWTTCMMFFQGVLLVGYAYAHLVAPRIGRWHLAAVTVPLVFLPIGIGTIGTGEDQIANILVALARGVAVPIALLSTTSVVGQTWLARADDVRGRDPYWLYAASNTGSLLALLAYPFVIEPLLGIRAQQLTWTALYLVYVALAFAVAPPRGVGPSGAAATPEAGGGPEVRATPALIGYWLVLSMAPSIMLMAVTNAISSDVGSIPLVWVAPLAIYLATFILTFRDRPWYPRLLRRYWPEIGFSGVFVLSGWLLFPNWPRIAWHLLVLFTIAMCGHSELYRTRPSVRSLTAFYLTMAAGGFAGGVFVGIVAPRLFDRLHEYSIAILMLVVTMAIARRADLRTWVGDRGLRLERIVRTPLLGAAFGLSWLWILPSATTQDVFLLRNYYGIYKVADAPRQMHDADGIREVPVKHLVHNGTIHGMEILAPGGSRVATTYYHAASPLGDVFQILGHPRKAAVIGLGTGATAAYFDAGDELVFYEIDADDEAIARNQFHFLGDCPANPRVVIGDARIELAADPGSPDGHFDAVIVDAFSGDAIPTHLLTKEALAAYLAKLGEDGLLVFNISNRFYDLRSVLVSTGATLGLHGAYRLRLDESQLEDMEMRSRWFVLTRNQATLAALAEHGWTLTDDEPQLANATPWTDDYVNVLAPLWDEVLRGKSL